MMKLKVIRNKQLTQQNLRELAKTDEECLKTFEDIKPKTLSWKECPMTKGRTTYEVVKSDEDS